MRVKYDASSTIETHVWSTLSTCTTSNTLLLVSSASSSPIYDQNTVSRPTLNVNKRMLSIAVRSSAAQRAPCW